MNGKKGNCKYLNEVWNRIRILEYDKAQFEKIRENKRVLRKIQLRWMLSIFGISTVLALTLYLKLGFDIVLLMISTFIFLIASQLYEYLSFREIRRKIYYEH